MKSSEKLQLQKFACNVRQGIIDSTFGAKAGHPGGSLSSADVMTYLYNCEMKINTQDPKWDERDRFVLSKGHCTPALYATLAYRGFFPVADLPTFRHIDSYLQGHPNMNTVPGVDTSTGSLGQGISVAAGMAKAAKYMDKNCRVYTLLGDGEIAEGECWEAFLFASHFNLDNLCVIIDLNGLQIDGATKDVMNTAPVSDKMSAFGFEVICTDGHDFDELEAAFNKAKNTKGKPSAILMKTTKGKGISFMENDAEWHGKAPNAEEHSKATAEINALVKELEAAQ